MPTTNHFKLPQAASAVMLFGLLSFCMVGAAQAQLIVSDSKVGYIDSAIPTTLLRLRFDAAYTTEFPDRVEFQYAKYGTPGAPLTEVAMDSHQELAVYFEYAPVENFSLFTELPVRWINPVVNANTGGLYDVNAGAKWAVHSTDCAVLSLQFRTIMATGDTDAGLSAGHASLEPAVLYLRQLSDRLTLEGELRDWIPIDASTTGPGGGGGTGGGGGGGMGRGGRREFGGNVLRYGVGLGYELWYDWMFTAAPVVELVGWHVFGGLKSTPDGQRISAAGDSIVNLKVGLRIAANECGDPLAIPFGQASSLYVGYGTVLTDAEWYSDMLRVELRLSR